VAFSKPLKWTFRTGEKIGQKIGNYFKNIKIIKNLNKKLYSACSPLILTKLSISDFFRY